MPKFIRSGQILLLTSITACITSAMVFIFLLTQSTDNYAQASSLNYNADQIIILVNKERKTFNLQPLKKENLLASAAEKKTNDMIINNYFSHISPVDNKKWSDFIQEVGYDYTEAGENLANGYLNAQEMVEAWMNSPTHKANILADGYKETGISVSKGKLNGNETIFVAQVFGKR